MAQKVQTLFIDDLDGSKAEGTVSFGLDGTNYQIDLNARHAQALRDSLERYVRAARRPAGAGAGHRPAGWTARGCQRARAQGIEVKNRGRVPAELMVQFRAATEH